MSINKIYPSSSAFMLGDMVMSDTSQGCLRFLLLKKYMPKHDPIKPEYAIMGEAGEVHYMNKLLTEQEWPFHRELPFKGSLDGIEISGRMDFVTYHDSYKVIHECKTSQSTSFLYGVIRAGKPKLNHIAQIVFYLIHMNETKAKLYTLYMPKMEERTFKIEISLDGTILIDAKPFTYKVADQLRHQVMSAETINTAAIANRPWGSACGYCIYKQECFNFDSNHGVCINDFKEVINV